MFQYDDFFRMRLSAAELNRGVGLGLLWGTQKKFLKNVFDLTLFNNIEDEHTGGVALRTRCLEDHLCSRPLVAYNFMHLDTPMTTHLKFLRTALKDIVISDLALDARF